MHLGVEGVRGGERGASLGAQQPVPLARKRAPGRAPGAEAAVGDGPVAEDGAGVARAAAPRRPDEESASSRAVSRSRSSTQTASSANACGPASRRHTGRSGSPPRNSSSPTGWPAAAEASRRSSREGRRGRPVGGAGTRREQHQTLARRLAGEREQEQRLGVALLGERKADAERRADPAALGVSEQGVGPTASREAALGQPREDHRVEAEAAQLQRREHRDAVASDPAARDPRAREHLAQHGRRLRQVDLLLQDGERLQARGGVAGLVRGVGVEHRGDHAGEGLGPVAPGCALGQSARRPAERGRRGLQAQQRRRRRRVASAFRRPRPRRRPPSAPRASRSASRRSSPRRRLASRAVHCSIPATTPACRASSSHSAVSPASPPSAQRPGARGGR